MEIASFVESTIALVLSIIAFICSLNIFKVYFDKINISVTLDSLSIVFDDADAPKHKLHIAMCNYADRDILVCFTSGYAQNGKDKIKICENQYVKLNANSIEKFDLDVEPDYRHEDNLKKELVLHYTMFGILHRKFVLHDFDEVEPTIKIRLDKYIPKTHLFTLHEVIHCDNPSVIESYVRQDLDIKDWLSVQSVQYHVRNDGDYDVDIKIQSDCSQTYDELEFNIMGIKGFPHPCPPRQLDREDFKILRDSVEIQGLEEYKNE